MNLRSKSFVTLSSALCLTMALATGCNTAGRTPQTPNQAGTTQIGQNMIGTTPGQGNMNTPNGNRGGLTGMLPGGNNGQGGNQAGTNNQGGANNYNGMQMNQQLTSPTGFDTQRANSIKRQLSGMNGLSNPNVIVNGNTALVGYTRSRTANNTNDMRNTLNNTIRQMDNSITNVVATDTPNFVTEINKLASEITNNSQAKGLGDRFNRLVQGIMPNNNNNTNTTR